MAAPKGNTFNTKHGHAPRNGVRTSVYRAWDSMISRCYLVSQDSYEEYGGRGITVCGSWRNSFEQFLSDMGEKPRGWSMDRIDPEGNYEPQNCRWASPITQANNKRNNKTITYNGKTQTIAQWARELKVPYHRLYLRIFRLGWSVDRALTE